MFATLLARTRVHSFAIALLLPIGALVSLGPAVLREVNSLSAESVYCFGLSGLLGLLGACALLALPRSSDEIGVVVGTAQRLVGAAGRASPLSQAVQGLALHHRRHRAV